MQNFPLSYDDYILTIHMTIEWGLFRIRRLLLWKPPQILHNHLSLFVYSLSVLYPIFLSLRFLVDQTPPFIISASVLITEAFRRASVTGSQPEQVLFSFPHSQRRGQDAYHSAACPFKSERKECPSAASLPLIAEDCTYMDRLCLHRVR